jgi:pilus assembly protein Flp/PilA
MKQPNAGERHVILNSSNQQGGTTTMVMLSMVLQSSFAYIADALKREEGQGFAEYALIFALVVIIAMAGLTPLGNNILAQFNAVANAL